MLRTFAIVIIIGACFYPNSCSVLDDSDLNITPTVDFFHTDEVRPFNLTITSNEISEPIEIDNGTIVNSDRIRLNAFFPDDLANPENDVFNVSMTTQTGFLIEASDELIIPSDWYDPFTMYMNYSSFNWEYVEVEINEVVDITLNFTNDDCDVLVWWYDTSQVAKIYATNLVGNQMASNDTHMESGSFTTERSGILAIGIFNFALQQGTYNLTVDTRESIFVTEVGNSALIDTWTWNRNVTFSLEIVGYSLAGTSCIYNYSSLTFNNYFSPSIDNLNVTVDSYLVTIEWGISDRNQNDSFRSDVGLSSGMPFFQFLGSNLSETRYVWDSSGFSLRDSYVIRVLVTDSSGLTGEAISMPVTAGIPGPGPPTFRLSIVGYPDDISYQEGTIGNEIVWQITVQNPYNASYQIHMDGVVYLTGTMESGDLVINVDGLYPNAYRFILTISSGTMTLTDTVRVTVLSGTFPFGAFNIVLPGLAIILIVSSIIVIEYHRKLNIAK